MDLQSYLAMVGAYAAGGPAGAAAYQSVTTAKDAAAQGAAAEAQIQGVQALVEANKKLGRPLLEGAAEQGIDTSNVTIAGQGAQPGPVTPEQAAQLMAGDMPAGGSGGDAAAISILQGLSEDEIIEAKKQLYYAGMYPDGVRPVPSAQLDPNDVKAMSEANTMGALNKTTWDKAIAQRATLGASQGVPFSQASSAEDDTNELDQAYQQSVTGLRAFAQANGLDLPERYIAQQATALATGQTSKDELEGMLRDTYVAGAYPAWADKIKAGANVSDLAAPYIGAMASALELDENEISLNDKMIQKALSAVDQKGNPTVMPLWQFKEQVKQDDRWQYTDGAFDDMSSLAGSMLSQMGLS